MVGLFTLKSTRQNPHAVNYKSPNAARGSKAETFPLLLTEIKTNLQFDRLKA